MWKHPSVYVGSSLGFTSEVGLFEWQRSIFCTFEARLKTIKIRNMNDSANLSTALSLYDCLLPVMLQHQIWAYNGLSFETLFWIWWAACQILPSALSCCALTSRSHFTIRSHSLTLDNALNNNEQCVCHSIYSSLLTLFIIH